MEWLSNLFFEHSALQAVVVLSIISAIGLFLGKIRFFGISLGVTFVFFMGILMGHFGVSVNADMLSFAEDFGLIIFVYALGLQVGPGFFSSFSKGGMQLNFLAIAVVLIGTFLAVLTSFVTDISLPDMVGILCGATTNTPALGAAQTTLKQMGLDATGPALGCAVTYPMGVIGVIIGILFIRKVFSKKIDIASSKTSDNDDTFIGAFQVHNPAIFGRKIRDLGKLTSAKFVISRLWRDGTVSIPISDKEIRENDRLLVVCTDDDVARLTILFGAIEESDWNTENIDWNAIDSQLTSKEVVITRPEINGKKLETLRLRNHYGVNISRVYRSDVRLLATSDLTLQLGDRVTIVGEASAINEVSKVLGNTIKQLNEPNLVAVFVGIVLGLALGAIPIVLPGISAPIKLGLAGGPIVVGILIGAFGPKFHMITYTTPSANLMLRGLGLTLYLACLGLDSGAHFFETVFRPEGALWIGIGFLLTTLPILIVGMLTLKTMKVDFGSMAGMLCGSMANPMALNYVNDTIEDKHSSVAYATVYPLSMFLRVIISQVLLMLLL
ncbi:putative transporter [Bacteroides propionicifaciens]|uniref:putative transporter n=1 Tax=Bacteroides propionicifaciens TaxID=392838 RepID=UPI00035F225E|nr:putative transporter [Bacteroides propionicifaciens]